MLPKTKDHCYFSSNQGKSTTVNPLSNIKLATDDVDLHKNFTLVCVQIACMYCDIQNCNKGWIEMLTLKCSARMGLVLPGLGGSETKNYRKN